MYEEVDDNEWGEREPITIVFGTPLSLAIPLELKRGAIKISLFNPLIMTIVYQKVKKSVYNIIT